jgi:uncharacterized protein
MVIVNIKKIILALFFIFFVALILVSYISYAVVKKFIFRRVHKQEWLIRNGEFNSLLCNEHGGRPVAFAAQDGMQLAGLVFIRPQAKRNFLMCHGYSRSKERLYNLVKLFPDDNILIFDYRAHGESQGDFTTIGYHEKNDVIAAFDLLNSYEKTKSLPTFGIGVSMGAVSLLGAASQGLPFKGIVIDSAFKRLDMQLAKMFPEKTGLPLMPFMNFCQRIFEYFSQCCMSDVDAHAWAEKLTIPIFIIHSNHDKLADVAAAHELYSKVPGPKKLWIVDNAHHAGIFKLYPQAYVREVGLFLDSIEV